MFNSHLKTEISELKKMLLEKELKIVELKALKGFFKKENNELNEKNIKLQDKNLALNKKLEEYEFVDEEEIELQRKLNKEALKCELAKLQIDHQKEVLEAYNMKPKQFSAS